jgi:SAM-dependent methyltransferase
MTDRHDVWDSGAAYEAYVGRWSRVVAAQFLDWLAVPAGSRWLDVGCGTGALTQRILDRCRPSTVVGVDASAGFLDFARTTVRDPRVTFLQGDARALTELSVGKIDAAVAGLVLNFVPDPAAAIAGMRRVATGGLVAAYVWDYAEGMEVMRHFWDAATVVDPASAELDEGDRFPLCRPDALRDAWTAAGLTEVRSTAVTVPTVFPSFDALWRPFLGGQGSAPGYAAALDPVTREALRGELKARVPVDSDGSVRLTARAWAVAGRAA